MTGKAHRLYSLTKALKDISWPSYAFFGFMGALSLYDVAQRVLLDFQLAYPIQFVVEKWSDFLKLFQPFEDLFNYLLGGVNYLTGLNFVLQPHWSSIASIVLAFLVTNALFHQLEKSTLLDKAKHLAMLFAISVGLALIAGLIPISPLPPLPLFIVVTSPPLIYFITLRQTQSRPIAAASLLSALLSYLNLLNPFFLQFGAIGFLFALLIGIGAANIIFGLVARQPKWISLGVRFLGVPGLAVVILLCHWMFKALN